MKSKITLENRNQTLMDSYKLFIQVKNYRGYPRNYIQPVEEFLVWSQSKGIEDIKQIKNTDLKDYFEYLSSRPNHKRGGTLSDSSINKHLLALRIFYNHLLEQKMINSSLIIPTRTDKTRIDRKILTVQEVKEVYAACINQFETALLSVSYGCGLRRKEIEKLNTVDIIFSKGILIVKSGKGGKRREIPMSDKVIEDLRAYLLGQRNEQLASAGKRVKSFFIGQLNSRMTGGQLNRRLFKILNRTGNQEIIDKNITLHCLRHTISTHLADNGASIDFIREFLGHALVDTSQIYAARRKRNKVFNV